MHEQFDNAYEREPDDATIVTSYPLVTISSILPSLDNLPAELIQEIARNSDDETIWRMRGVCHHVRNSVEAELNLRLVNQVLVCDPPFSGHSEFSVRYIMWTALISQYPNMRMI